MELQKNETGLYEVCVFVKSRSDPVTFTHCFSGWTGVHTCVSEVCS